MRILQVIKICILAFFLLKVLLSNPTIAMESTKYYREVFSTWGVKGDIYDNNLIPTKNDTLFLNSFDYNEYIINEGRYQHSNVIVIVSELLEIDEELDCNFNLCKSTNSNSNKLIFLGKNLDGVSDITLAVNESSHKSILFIPEEYLLTPDIAKKVESFFRITSLVDNDNTEDFMQIREVLENVKIFTHEPLGEFLIRILILLIFSIPIVLTYEIFKKKYIALGRPKNLDVWANDFLRFLNKHRRLIISVTILMSLILFLTFLRFFNRFLTISDTLLFFWALLQRMSLTLPQSWEVFYSNVFILLVGTYIIIWTLIIIMYVSQIRYFIVNTIFSNKLKVLPTIISFLLVTYLLIHLFFAKNIQNNLFFIASLLVALIYLLISIKTSHHKLNDLLSLKSKVVMTLSIFVLIVGEFAVLYFRPNEKITLVQKSIVDSQTNVIPLPYYKDVSSKDIFKQDRVTAKSIVAVNNVLVFDPRFQNILNVPVKDFYKSDNFMILSPSREKFIKSIGLYPFIRLFIETKDLTRYFIINNPNNLAYKNFRLNIEIACVTDTKPFTVVLTRYPLASEEPIKNSVSKKVLNFPGCIATEKNAPISYTVNLPNIIELGDDFLYELEAIDKYKINSFKILNAQGSISIVNIKNPMTHPVLYVTESAEIGKQELVVFSFDLNKNISIQRNSDDFEIGNVINKLILENIINERIKVWSFDKYSSLVVK